jgi:mannose-6-phosphate isomerase-like protein (cupin superfamily)
VINGHEYIVTAGDAVVVPAGAHHNIINTSTTESFKMYTIYAPPHHRDGVVHHSKAAAQADKESFDGKVIESTPRASA